MTTDDIWTEIHSLVQAFDAAGPDQQQRLQVALLAFERMPPTTRRQLLSDLQTLVRDLNALLPAIADELGMARAASGVPPKPGND